MEYDYLIYIGRFQPYHKGHHQVALEALRRSTNLIYVLGSHDAALSIRNPYTTAERVDIIRSAFDTVEFDRRIHFAPQIDHTYNDARWLAAIQSSIQSVLYRTWDTTLDWSKKPKIGVIGYNKDQTSFYLDKFRSLYDVIEIVPETTLNAIDIRKELLGGDQSTLVYAFQSLVDQFFCNDRHATLAITRANKANLIEQYRYVQENRKKYGDGPFVTTDAVVVHGSKILRVVRGGVLGHGDWALPGGFLEKDLTLYDNVLKELSEETMIGLPKEEISHYFVRSQRFDDPQRSVRGRTITEAFLFRFPGAMPLPNVTGADDAKEADWITLGEVTSNRNKWFDDHCAIIEVMLGL